MSTRKNKTVILMVILIVIVLAAQATVALANPTREFLGSFGSLTESARGVSALAVDEETGNVYVGDTVTDTIHVFGAGGGAPIEGVPSEIKETHFGPSPYGPVSIAIDNSCYEHQPRLTGRACEEYDPSYGDLYVTGAEPLSQGGGSVALKYKLTAGHTYELADELSTEQIFPLRGVTVDAQGDIYLAVPDGRGGIEPPGPVVEFKKLVEKATGGREEFTERLQEVVIPQSVARVPGFVAIDDSGQLYVGTKTEEGLPGESENGVAKLKVGANGEVSSEEKLVANRVGAKRPVAVDRLTGSVFVGNESEVEEFSSTGVPSLTFGSTEQLGGSLGIGAIGVDAIAVDGERERVYVANPLHGDVDVFGPELGIPVIPAAQPPVSAVTRTGVLVAATANPESEHADYYFQFVADGEYEPDATDPYMLGGRTAIQPLTGGHVPVTVERAALTGLSAGTTYHYRIVVTNAAGTTTGPDETFTTSPGTPPLVVTGAASAVEQTSVVLSGIVSPRGLSTSYTFEIGSDTGYTGARLFGNAGSSTSEVPVSVSIQYLIPGTRYHYRVSARNFDGTSYGEDGTFTTPGIPSWLVQPATQPLIVSTPTPFPTVSGAPTTSRKAGHAGKKKQLQAALRVCRKQRSHKRRSKCEARAHKKY